MTRKLPHRRYEELKALAADLIEDYGPRYPLDPFQIASILGVRVIVHRGGLPAAALLCSTTDGYTIPVQTEHGVKFEVHLNGATSPVRQRFTLMHELAHIWLDHLRADESLSEDSAEAEANFLANYLLAPDVLVLEWVPNLTVGGISQKFELSGEAAGHTQRRVMRMLNTKAQGREYDRRIHSSAALRGSA